MRAFLVVEEKSETTIDGEGECAPSADPESHPRGEPRAMGGSHNSALVPAAYWVAASVPSVGTPGPTVDPHLFTLFAGLCVALLAFGIGALIVLSLHRPRK